MNTNIVETIQARLECMGISQAQFAECVSATPAQMSIFLREKGSLSTECLNKCLNLIGIDLSLYSKRNKLAKEVALYLLSKNVTSIDNWSKEDLALFTQKKSISLLFDIKSEKELMEMKQSGIIDIESTFPYFKALVSYHMLLKGEKTTASQADQALSILLNKIDTTKDNILSSLTKFGLISLLSPASSIVDEVTNMLSEQIMHPKQNERQKQNKSSKQFGAISLFTKQNMPSLFAKALEFIKK